MVSRSRWGIALRDDVAVTVGGRRTGTIIARTTREPGEGLTAFLTRALATTRSSWLRPRVTMVVADARCRTVPLFGESTGASLDEIMRSFHAVPQAYTIGGGEGLVPGIPWLDGETWRGTVLSGSLADSLLTACADARVELVGVVPGGELAGSDLDALAMEARTLSTGHRAHIVPDLAARERRRTQRRRAVLGVAAAGALLWAATAPVIASYRTMRTLEQAAVDAERFIAAATEQDSRVAGIADLRAFAHRVGDARSAVGALLHDVAGALPDSAAVTTLRIDPEGGTLTLVATQVDEVITRLSGVPTLRTVRVTGSIVEDVQAGPAFRRVTLTWSHGGAP